MANACILDVFRSESKKKTVVRRLSVGQNEENCVIFILNTLMHVFQASFCRKCLFVSSLLVGKKEENIVIFVLEAIRISFVRRLSFVKKEENSLICVLNLFMHVW